GEAVRQWGGGPASRSTFSWGLGEPTGRKDRPLGERLQLGPGDVGVDAAAEAAVRARHHALPTHQLREAHDAIGDQLRVLDDVGGVAAHTADADLSLWQFHGAPS